MTRSCGFIAVPNAVVTVAASEVQGIEDAVDAHAGDPRFGTLDAGTFLGLLLDGMLDGYHSELEAIERDVDRVDEAALRKEPVQSLLSSLVSIRRRGAILRRSLAPQRSVYQTLARPSGGQGSPIGAPWPALIDRLEDTIDSVERAHDLLVGSFDIVMTRTGQRTNDIMRVLTVISSVLLPSMVIAGIMGMDFHPDFFDQPWLFWLVLVFAHDCNLFPPTCCRRRPAHPRPCGVQPDQEGRCEAFRGFRGRWPWGGSITLARGRQGRDPARPARHG